VRAEMVPGESETCTRTVCNPWRLGRNAEVFSRPKDLTNKGFRRISAVFLTKKGEGRSEEVEGKAPNSARPHVALGNLLSLKGQDDQASEYQTALKLDPRNAGTYVLMGMAQKKDGHAELREKAHRQAPEI
jgi:hypothetical protein